MRSLMHIQLENHQSEKGSTTQIQVTVLLSSYQEQINEEEKMNKEIKQQEPLNSNQASEEEQFKLFVCLHKRGRSIDNL